MTGSFPVTGALNETAILPEGHQRSDFKTKLAEVECEAFTNPLQGRGHIFHAVCSSIVIYMIYGNKLYIKHRCRCFVILKIYVARDSSAGIVTRYELNGPGIENLWRRVFPHPSKLVLGSNQRSIRWVSGHSWG